MTDTGASDYFVEFSPGDYVFRQNDEGKEMFIVEDGEIEIVLEDATGESLLTTLERGDFFGEMAILENLPRATSARARAATRLLRINRSVFDQIIRTNPEFAVRMLRALSSRLREADSAQMGRGAPASKKGAGQVDKPRTAAPKLQSASGADFTLNSSGETTIGRYDTSTNMAPDVDLTALDEKKTTSRRHARIFERDGRYFVQEDVGTANGTFVRGTRIQPGVETELNHGDPVAFGGVELVFENS